MNRWALCAKPLFFRWMPFCETRGYQKWMDVPTVNESVKVTGRCPAEKKKGRNKKAGLCTLLQITRCILCKNSLLTFFVCLKQHSTVGQPHDANLPHLYIWMVICTSDITWPLSAFLPWWCHGEQWVTDHHCLLSTAQTQRQITKNEHQVWSTRRPLPAKSWGKTQNTGTVVASCLSCVPIDSTQAAIHISDTSLSGCSAQRPFYFRLEC